MSFITDISKTNEIPLNQFSVSPDPVERAKVAKETTRNGILWMVRGWYLEEFNAYKIAEQAWEKLKNSVPKKASEYIDFFGFKVTTPIWFLHNNGTWHKSLIDSQHHIRGEFDSYHSAAYALNYGLNKPPAVFVGYEAHLRRAKLPDNLIYHSESVHSI